MASPPPSLSLNLMPTSCGLVRTACNNPEDDEVTPRQVRPVKHGQEIKKQTARVGTPVTPNAPFDFPQSEAGSNRTTPATPKLATGQSSSSSSSKKHLSTGGKAKAAALTASPSTRRPTRALFGVSQQEAEQRQARMEWTTADAALRHKTRALEGGSVPGHGVAELLAPAYMMAEEMQDDRNGLRGQLAEGAACLRANLACFAEHLEIQTDENTRRDLLEASGAQMAEFRQLQHAAVDDLRVEEEALTRELALFAERMASPEWEAPALAGASGAAVPTPSPHYVAYSPQPTPTSSRPSSRVRGYGPCRTPVSPGDAPPEVVAVEEFEELNGRYGGWDEADHRRFKKALTRAGEDHRRVLPFAEEALPEFSTAAIEAHIAWDFEHEELLTRRRAAIQLWRMRREEQKHSLSAADAAAASPAAARAEHQAAALEKEAGQLRREEERAALAEWRDKKAKAAIAIAEAAEAAEVARAEKKKAEAARRRAQNLAALEEHKIRKAAADEARRHALVSEDEPPPTRPASRGTLDALHARNLRIMEKRRLAASAKDREREAREQRLRRASASVQDLPSDPSRLLRPTKSAQMRAERVVDVERKAKSFFMGAERQQRAVPAWRAKQ